MNGLLREGTLRRKREKIFEARVRRSLIIESILFKNDSPRLG